LIPPVVSIVSNFVFYSLILYAVGVTINRIFAYTATKPTAEGETGTPTINRGATHREAVTGSAVQDTVARSSTMDTNQGESDVVHNAGKDATLRSVAEEESDESQETVEDSMIEPTTAESNGQAEEEEVTSEETSRKR
jgi:hypothetical protein